jgi:CheY-like chemotaxis protein/anti-sigma regulatory factor (Ser/Thr protein kinase)
VLEFSKIEAGKLTLVSMPFQPAKLIADTLQPLLPSASQKAIAMQFFVADDVPETLLGDAGRLQQVLINLLGNAIKFTHQGVISLNVTLLQLMDEFVTLKFAVQDTGIGIDPARQADVFEAFGQEGPLTAKTYGGTGLGLSISRRLVELMEGQIGVTSQPGVGSTFYFTARLRRPLAGMLPLALPTPADAQSQHGQSHRSLNILLVEDYIANQAYALDLLQYLGHQVTVASNGQEALEQVVTTVFDLVLMDLQMPVMDGLEATRRIRAAELSMGRSRVNIIAMTAITQHSEISRCFAAGMDDFVAKPFTPDDLAKHLNLV